MPEQVKKQSGVERPKSRESEGFKPIRCPTCSRVNPAQAAYCFYDGRTLNATGDAGPVGLGTRPFPLPFSFSDGQGCSNYNQLVLACDRHWNEARTNLHNGTWETFFSTIGRADLAVLAKHSARETDPDLGLCRLLEGLPADAEALPPPKLGVPSLTEDLGELEPGKDHKFQLVIENQGSLLLSGSAMTDCDWLLFGERQGTVSSKLFQTRDNFTLVVRVPGHALRAGKKPLIGEIVVATNGGRKTVTVRANVSIRPFPKGKDDNNVLAGATTPRELAVKAKEHPKEAAALFEQGVVKAWYESNGWMYPIQGTQARGKGALQQFFEALGLTKPPRLEIDTEKIECRGEVGKRLTRNVVIRAEEARLVYADAQSPEDWLKVLPAKSQGNSVTIPLSIEIPDRPGETLHTDVTFQGNGQQQFVVPVTLTVAGITPRQREKKARRGRQMEWIVGVVGLCLLLVVGTTVALIMSNRGSGQEDPPPDNPRPGPPVDPTPQAKAWWDAIPGNKLGASSAKLKEAAGANRPMFESLEAEADGDRRKGYEQLAAKLPELARNPAMRAPLGQFITECCVHERSDFNLTPLLRGLAAQFPGEDREFPAEDKGEGIERASFWLGVVCDAISHKATRPERRRDLANELSSLLGVDPDTPQAELKDRAEKALAELCYHNTVPTAEKSIEQALTIRDVLLAKFARHLSPQVREQDDVKLLAIGMPNDVNLWPKLKPIFESCAKSNDISVGFKLIDLYEKANPELTPKLEEVLAVRWKVAGNAKLVRADKVAAIRNSMASHARAAKISYEERVKQLQLLLGKKPWSPKPDGPKEIATLQETVLLAHASTMASILFNKDAEVGRFDELIVRLPLIEQGKPIEEIKPDENPRQREGKEVIDMRAGGRVLQSEFTNKSEVDPRRGTYRKEYWLQMKAREIYHIYMKSTALTPYIRLESSTGQQLFVDKGANAHITFVPQTDGDYHLVVSSVEKETAGPFTLQLSLQQQVFGFGPPRRIFGKPFMPSPPFIGPGPGPVPGPGPDMGGGGETRAPQVNASDLAELVNKQKDVRIRAFKNLAGSVSNDEAYRHALRMANYLLVTDWDDSELTAATEALQPLTRCRSLLESLADVIGKGDKLAQQRTVAVVGVMLSQPNLRFDRDDDWRSACRKMLLHRALELTGRTAPATNDADKAANFLRDLYKEQGLAFGLETPEFEELTQFAPVLASLIKHVAARAAQQPLPPADKASLEQIGRQLQAVQFVARNDLELVVLLQRIWVKVLVLALQGQTPEQNRKTLLEIPQELDKKDLVSTNLLDELRSGEETALRVWALARNLKVK
jgi:hypothetical protein